MVGGGGETNDLALQLAWLDEVERTILMHCPEDIPLDVIVDLQGAPVHLSQKDGKAVRIADCIDQVNGVLRTLDVRLPPQHYVLWRVNPVEIGIIESKLHPHKFHAQGAACSCCSILHGKKY